MLLLIITFTSLFYNISGKIYSQIIKDELYEYIDSVKQDVEYINGDPLWVLHLNYEKWLEAKLTLGNFADEKDFYYAAGRIDKDSSNNTPKSGVRVKKDDPERPKIMTKGRRSNSDLRKAIMVLLNKFVLSASYEPDAYVKENEDGSMPSITLYFKGPMSCLIVKQENKEWHYLSRTMLFPAWFYERHDTYESPLDIPNEVKNEFYNSLYRFLQLVVNHHSS